MLMMMKTGNAVITPNEAEKKNIVEYYANCDAKTNDSLIALDLAEVKAKAKAEAKAKAKAKAEAEEQAFILESEPLSIILLKIEQEINAFIDSEKTRLKSFTRGNFGFTVFVEEYMAANSIDVANEMNKLIDVYNNAITTFVNANKSNFKSKYDQKRRKRFETHDNCTCGCGNGGTCIIFTETAGHFHKKFMSLYGFGNFAQNRIDENNASATYRP